MSFGIVRIQKFTAGSVKGIEIHDRRKKDGISHTNGDIEWDKSHLNYDLCKNYNLNFRSAVNKRISELDLKRAVRKDAIVMAQALVTSDRAFFDSMSKKATRQFFEDSYNFIKDRYGEKNIISATVHLDEKTPHIHINFVPVTDDNRLSAKSLLNRIELKSLQTDFYKQVGQEYGLLRGEEGSTKKHLETQEFKLKTLEKQVENAKADIIKFREFNNSNKEIKSNIENINADPLMLNKNYLKISKNDFDKLKNFSMEYIEKIDKINFYTQDIEYQKNKINGIYMGNQGLTQNLIDKRQELDKIKQNYVELIEKNKKEVEELKSNLLEKTRIKEQELEAVKQKYTEKLKEISLDDRVLELKENIDDLLGVIDFKDEELKDTRETLNSWNTLFEELFYMPPDVKIAIGLENEVKIMTAKRFVDNLNDVFKDNLDTIRETLYNVKINKPLNVHNGYVRQIINQQDFSIFKKQNDMYWGIKTGKITVTETVINELNELNKGDKPKQKQRYIDYDIER